jgi:hypothetical protein
MNPVSANTPSSPAPLSEQERQELEAAEKGYDPSASALPDSDDPGSAIGDQRAKIPLIPESERAPPHHKHPVSDAHKKGLLPGSDVSGPPLDGPEE